MTKINKELIVDAICGRPITSHKMAGAMEKRGLAKFTGNQWNEAWSWRRDELMKLSLVELKLLYDQLKHEYG